MKPTGSISKWLQDLSEILHVEVKLFSELMDGALISPSLTTLSLEEKCPGKREEWMLFCLIVFF